MQLVRGTSPGRCTVVVIASVNLSISLKPRAQPPRAQPARIAQSYSRLLCTPKRRASSARNAAQSSTSSMHPCVAVHVVEQRHPQADALRHMPPCATCRLPAAAVPGRYVKSPTHSPPPSLARTLREKRLSSCQVNHAPPHLRSRVVDKGRHQHVAHALRAFATQRRQLSFSIESPFIATRFAAFSVAFRCA